MKAGRSEEEWDLIEQEANRAKIRELNEALEDSDLPTYDDLKQEVERLRGALNRVTELTDEAYHKAGMDAAWLEPIRASAQHALDGRGDNQK
jgi:phage-related tail protein